MKVQRRRWQLVLPLAAGVLLLDPFLAERLSAEPTDTELGTLIERLNELERELGDVQETLYSNAAGADVTGATAPTSGATDTTTERLMQRVDDLDRELRRLTGEVEELGYRIDQLTQQFERFSGETVASGPAPRASGPGQPVSGNEAPETGPAPGETTIGQIPTDAIPASTDNLTPEEEYQRALSYLQQQDYPRAEAALRLFISDHGESELAGPAMFWLGEAYFAQEKWTEAAQTYLDALKKYPDSPKAPDSMLKLGMSLVALGEKSQACLAFRDLPKKYPNASPTILQRAKVESERAGC